MQPVTMAYVDKGVSTDVWSATSNHSCGTGDGFGVRVASCHFGAVYPTSSPTARELCPILSSPVALPRVTASSKNKQITASFRDAGERKESQA